MSLKINGDLTPVTPIVAQGLSPANYRDTWWVYHTDLQFSSSSIQDAWNRCGFLLYNQPSSVPILYPFERVFVAQILLLFVFYFCIVGRNIKKEIEFLQKH